MEIEIKSNKENKALERKEIEAYAKYEGMTPKREDVKEAICKKLGLDPSSTIVIKIAQEYGDKKSFVLARSYSSKEIMERIEHEHLRSRGSKAKDGAKPAGSEDNAPNDKKSE